MTEFLKIYEDMCLNKTNANITRAGSSLAWRDWWRLNKGKNKEHFTERNVQMIV